MSDNPFADQSYEELQSSYTAAPTAPTAPEEENSFTSSTNVFDTSEWRATLSPTKTSPTTATAPSLSRKISETSTPAYIPEGKNFPACKPMVRLAIQHDIPKIYRPLVRITLLCYIACVLSTLFNMLTCFALLVSDGPSNSSLGTGTEFGISIAYFVMMPIFGWVWFKSIYNGTYRDRNSGWICFFVQMAITLGFLIICLIGIDATAMIGIVAFIEIVSKWHTHGHHEALVVMGLITLILYCIATLTGCWALYLAHYRYKRRGLEDEIRQQMQLAADEIISGKNGDALKHKLLSNEETRNALLQAATRT